MPLAITDRRPSTDPGRNCVLARVEQSQPQPRNCSTALRLGSDRVDQMMRLQSTEIVIEV